MPQGEPFFTIGDAALMIGVVPATLRNWEKVGLIKPGRQNGNYRIYSLEHIERLKTIKHLIQVKGFNIVGVKEYLTAYGEKVSEASVRLERQGTRIAVGHKLKVLRDKKNMTLEEVSQYANVSISYLSRIESGQVNVLLAKLQKLATFYQRNLLYFFEGLESSEQKLIKNGHGKTLETDEEGTKVEVLTALKEPLMESLLYRVAPGAGRNENISHEGEEFVHGLSGILVEIWLDETERYVVTGGDSFSFMSMQQHRWRNISNQELLVLWVSTPPTF